MPETVIIDIDGVLADNSHRLKYIEAGVRDWVSFYKACVGDVPITAGVRLLEALSRTTFVHLLTGRSEIIREETIRWLELFTTLRRSQLGITWELLMRGEKDHRPDYVYKHSVIKRLRSEGFEILLFVDDRIENIATVRELGVSAMHFMPPVGVGA